MRQVWCFLAVLVLAQGLQAAVREPVRLDSGLVTGVAGTNPAVRVFRGIPYAASPLGNLRWRPPEPAAPWDGVRKADRFGAMCMQSAFGGGGSSAKPSNMSEDCLFLNVWTAAASASARRPVMVWIHPGGYSTGAGSTPDCDGEALAKKGVVLVTINYRLGVFGFFSHPDLTGESEHRASGNYGFLDQVAALRWVQKNIAGFGGDPQRVTVFGDSAGSASIAVLMGSPLAKGLFQRAIGESGAWMGISLAPMRTLAEAEQAGVKTAEALHAPTLRELRAKTAEELLQAGRGGGPVIDGWFLPEDVGATFAAHKQNDVALLAGSNKDEGTFFVQPTTAAKFTERMRARFGERADAFLKLYPAGTDEEANASQLAAFRDELAVVMRVWVRAQAKTGRSKAFLYYFTHEPPAPVGGTVRGGFGSGATHGAEAQYVFRNLAPPRPWTDLDRQVSDVLSSYWVNFAANGDPNGKGLAEWPAFDEHAGVPGAPGVGALGWKSDRPMVLGDRAEVGPAPNPAQLAFFESWYEKQR
jgi:para-nitrobenzyl esterase